MTNVAENKRLNERINKITFEKCLNENFNAIIALKGWASYYSIDRSKLSEALTDIAKPSWKWGTLICGGTSHR